MGSVIARIINGTNIYNITATDGLIKVYMIPAASYLIAKESSIHFLHTSEDLFSAEPNLLFDKSFPSDSHGVLPTTWSKSSDRRLTGKG